MRSKASVVTLTCVAMLVVVPPQARADGPAPRDLVFERWAGPAYVASTVYAMTEEGTDQRALTQEDLDSEETPEWSPDGSHIAYVEGSDLWVMRSDGTEKRRVRGLPGYAWHPSWSPDGRRIAFHNYDSTKGCCDIYTIRLDGSGLKKIAEGFQPTWSPDGRWLAYGRFAEGRRDGTQLWLVSPAGTKHRQLTFGQIDADYPEWAPNGEWIAFSGGRPDPSSPYVYADDIFVVSARTGELRKVTSSDDYDIAPCWSPDGSRIGFSRSPFGMTVGLPSPSPVSPGLDVQFDLYVADLDGGNIRRIALTPEASELWCDWA